MNKGHFINKTFVYKVRQTVWDKTINGGLYSHAALVSKIRTNWRGNSPSYNEFCSGGILIDDLVVVYSLEKRRGRRTRSETGALVPVGEPTHWIARITYFPVELLKISGQKVVQYSGNWVLEPINSK